jgi:hypothetical protein
MVGNDLTDPVITYGQAYVDDLRERVLIDREGEVFGKRARICAVTVPVPFIVHTDRGPMTGLAGDWLVTNHPADDPGSDIWTISDERLQATYFLIDRESGRPGLHQWPTSSLLREVVDRLRDPSSPNGRHVSLAITKVEEALLWLMAGPTLD